MPLHPSLLDQAPGVTRRAGAGRRLAAALLLTAASLSSPAASAPQDKRPTAEAKAQQQCLAHAFRGRSPEITCDWPVRMTEAELAEARRRTRDYLQDATCTMKVRIERRLLDEALATPDHTFEAPPQPVACTIITRDGTFPVEFTFAPRVVLQGGQAVAATPGMANVTGVPRLIAWPVEAWVNSSAIIQGNMVAMINVVLRQQGKV